MASAVAGVVDEDPPHRDGGDAEEVRAALPVGPRLVDEFEVGLVDEGGRVECMTVALAPEALPGHRLQFIVDEG